MQTAQLSHEMPQLMVKTTEWVKINIKINSQIAHQSTTETLHHTVLYINSILNKQTYRRIID